MLDILHEDADVLVVDKPAGLVCHPTKAGPLSSLIARVRMHLGHDEGRLVHRLDRETAGVVVVAKGAVVARALGAAFAASSVGKSYQALVHGAMSDPVIVIRAPLGRDVASAVAIKDGVRVDGAVAETEVRLREVWSTGRGEMSLVDVLPRTGRKHQIRIHLAHAGHPIVGDKIYGDDESRYLRLVEGALTEADRDALVVEHHALHATRVDVQWGSRTESWTSRLDMVDVWRRRVGTVTSCHIVSD